VFGQDLRRTLLSWPFFVAVLGLAIVSVATLFDEYQFTAADTSILYLQGLMDYRDFYIVFLLFAALPGTTLFCSDWDNRYIRFSAMRSSKNVYAASKALACFCSAVSSVFLSGWLTVFIFSFKYSLYLPRDSNGGFGVYQFLITPEGTPLYLVISFLCKGFCAGFLSVLALWFSTKVTNVFVTLATPILAYYMIQVVGFAIPNMPSCIAISNLTKARVIMGGPGLSLLYTLGVFSVLAALFGFMFVNSCKRRISNG
ncbi:MAG: hypothetical protein RSC76_06005, partial [Oscillospiraceae bacterium]